MSAISRIRAAVPSTSARPISAPLSKRSKKQANPNARTLPEAYAFLRAIEAQSPTSALELSVKVKMAASQNINALRGRIFLPHQSSHPKKKTMLLVFAEGQEADAARNAGADVVGGAELVEKLLDGSISPNKIIATPTLISSLTRDPRLPRFLGPKGLMPSAKRGTVTSEITKAVQDARGGLDWIGDANGVVRVPIARVGSTMDQVEENVKAMLDQILKVADGESDALFASMDKKKKSDAASIIKAHLSSTRGPGIELSTF